MKRFTISEAPLVGLKLVERKRLTDMRGFLARIFCADEFAAIGWSKPIAQINQTSTLLKGTIRGMHFQYPPHSEMKLVSCLRGEVWDVAIDIRSGSPTFLNWHGVCLSAENGRALLIPDGVAHGFQSLTDNAELLYCHTAAYVAKAEGGLNPNDPELAIKWPLTTMEISERDVSHPLIKNGFKGV